MPDKPLAVIKPGDQQLEPVSSYRPYGPYGGQGPIELESRLLAYWRVVLVRKWLVMAIAVIVFTGVAVATFKQTPRYRASASMVLNDRKPTIISNFGAVPVSSAYDDVITMQTEMELLTSRVIAERTVDRMQLLHNSQANPGGTAGLSDQELEARRSQLVAMIMSGLKVTQRRGTKVIDISFESSKPELASGIANNVMEAFISYDRENRTTLNKDTREWLNQQVKSLKENVEQSQKKLVDYTREHPVMPQGGDKGTNVTVERLSALNRSLTEAEDKRIGLEAQLRIFKGSADGPLPDGSNETISTALLQRRSELLQKLNEVQAEYQDNQPPVLAAKAQLEELDGQIKNIKKVTREQALAKFEAQLAAAVQREKDLRASFEATKNVALEESDRSVAYQIYKQEADANQTLYTDLLRRQKEADLTAGQVEAPMRTVDLALVPTFRSYPPVTTNLALGGILGLALGIGLAFLLDYLDNTVKTAEDVTQLLRTPALGVIPALGTINKRRLLPGGGGANTVAELISQHPAESTYAEAYRSLRTSVLLSSAEHAPKTLMVTSPQPAEGKTTTAINIAISLSQTGAKVLIIDGDMRRPRCHKALGATNKKGLSTYLSTDISLDELIIPTESGVFLLPCGPIPPNPSELLTSAKLARGLSELQEKFDHIVLDSPPVATVSDGLILSTAVEGVVLVIQSGQTSRQMAQRAQHMIQSVGAKLFGVVLNKVDAGSRYYYEYYYKFGYYSYQELGPAEENV